MIEPSITLDSLRRTPTYILIDLDIFRVEKMQKPDDDEDNKEVNEQLMSLIDI